MSGLTLGSTTGALRDLSANSAFHLLETLGVATVELGAGNYLDTTHLNPKQLLRPGAAMGEFKALLAQHHLTVSALSCCGNPVHPNKDIASAHHQTFVDTCKLAASLGADTVVAFSGCPGDCAASKYPNFVSQTFPPEMNTLLEWQWSRVLVPYWKEASAIAASYGIRRIAIEMMPGNCVYNPQTLLRLRNEIGVTIGAAFDPAHLVKQGIDPVNAAKTLAGTVFQVHVRDILANTAVVAANGTMSTAPDAQPFIMRAIGNGHDIGFWRSMIKELVAGGYDRSITIEYDDADVPAEQGLALSVAATKKAMM